MSEREELVATLAAISAKRLDTEVRPIILATWDQLQRWMREMIRLYAPHLRRLDKYARSTGLIESENARRRRVWRAKREGRR